MASNCIFVRLQITGIIQFVPHALIFSSVKKRVRPQNQLLKLVYKKVLLYCLLSYSKRSKMKAVFDRNLRKMMCVSLTLLAKSCKILSDRKWFKMTHFQKWKAIFNFLKRKLFLNIFVKLNKKAARKLQTCIWYLRNALQNNQQALVLDQSVQNSKNSISFIL